MFHYWDWDGAETSFRRAIELDPNYGPAYQWYATLLMIRGRPEEAVGMLNKALETDPASHNYITDRGQAHFYLRNYKAAEADYLIALEMMPDFGVAQIGLSHLYVVTGEYEKAIRLDVFGSVNQFLSHLHEPGVIRQLEEELEDRLKTLREQGPQAEFGNVLSRVSTTSEGDVGRSRMLILTGQHEEALTYVERAVDNKAFMAPFMNPDPIYDPIRNHPRFKAAMAKMKL